MPNPSQWAAARARQVLQRAIRQQLESLGYHEVETPLLVPAPGMEPHIRAFEAPFVPETELGRPRTLYLHTSPEYAMKRLLADGSGPIFQICKVFRNGEVSPTHNPEFTMLELYRPHADYRAIMDDLESTLAAAAAALGRPEPFGVRPYERVTVREALRRETGLDLHQASDAPALAEAARRVGVRTEAGDGFDDVFFRLFLERVEPRLGRDRPVFLIDYPASMAALARLSPQDPSVAERFELYARGLELANGFSELTDAVEQRRRLEEERAFRIARGRPAYPLDEPFLEAVGRMPPSGGVAIGLDRVLMLLLGAERIEDVLLFPAQAFV
ncbi:MAG TPA: EF-P lysine aminoacylase EpmA [Myxococcaceae bacterium]|nr:EF-P lysine aminoacylase EpmA [Myxococcaceae bacterium]